MPLIEKRYMVEMDGDTDARQLATTSLLNAMNCRMAVTEYGRSQRRENLPGTTLISQSVYPPYGTQQCLGGCVDTENSWVLYFMWNSFNDHGIYLLDYSAPSTPVIYPVIYDSQTTDGLGFSKNYRIDRNCRVINGVLYWTDNLAQPRKINIRAGVNLNRPGTFPDAPQYAGGIDENIITIIRKPPNYFLSVDKVTQSSPVINANQLTLFAGKFSAFYDFIDNETSVLTGYSPLVPYNFKTDTYNAIDISFSFGDIIPQDVQKVSIAVQLGSNPNFFVIKIWDKANATDAAEIVAHNAGVTELTYRFYNDQTGIPLSSAYSVKPYDSVPLLSKTIETVRNRIHLGNNTEGYDTPLVTSLDASFTDQSSGTSLQGSVFKLVFSGGGATKYVIYFPSITGGNPPGYYRDTVSGDTTPPVSPVPQANLVFISSNETAVFQYYVPGWPTTPIDSFTFQNYVTVTGVSNPLLNQQAYKSGAAYKIATVFYDRWMRKCGVVVNGEIYITEDRLYTISSYAVSLDWILSNSNAVNEIPDWAEYYTVVRTKCLSTNYFIQARSRNTTSSMSYVTKDANDAYVFSTSAYSTLLAGVGVDITNLTNFGMGYTFSNGDLIKVYISSSVYTLRITGQDGRWLICELQNLGSLTATTDALFEIYTPYTPSINEAYYEVGQIYAINNPGESNREYSVTAGSIRGDIWLLSRGTAPNDYITENMSPNDTYWMNWLTDAGRPNFIDTIGQVEKPNNISYSNTFIPGTRTNGLSSFDALDEKDIPHECGAIQKLQVASKVTGQGNIMLAICKQNVVSLYMGEVQVTAQDSPAFLAQAPDVIGTMNVLKYNYGTTMPSTVVERHGLVFGYDLLNGLVWQYADNGLVPISDYKMARFFKNYAKDFLATNNSNLDNINGFHHIPSGIDPFTKELIIECPGLIYSNYASVLPSYSGVVPSYATSITDRFDIYDQLQKTMSFSYEENRWGQNYNYGAEFYEYINNTMIGWKNGLPYIHNSDTTNWNRFYGVDQPMRICGVANVNMSLLKDLANISIEGSVTPNYTVAMANYPNEQITDLSSTDEAWEYQQGNLYAEFYRDRLSPNVSGTAIDKMYSGDQLTDIAIFWMIEIQAYTELVWIDAVNIGWEISRGQKAIAEPINK
jgi:hypothetical protein